MDIFEIARKKQEKAWQIIEETHIFKLWQEIGAEIHIVGSLKSGLLIQNRDIDIHIYTDEVIFAESFAVLGKLAANPSVKEMHYWNYLQTEEECLQWQVFYEDREKNIWKMDLVHIRKGSACDGMVEGVTETIIKLLTPETRQVILQIKYELPDDLKVNGIEVYYAVLEHGVRSTQEFTEWRKSHPITEAWNWRPHQRNAM